VRAVRFCAGGTRTVLRRVGPCPRSVAPFIDFDDLARPDGYRLCPGRYPARKEGVEVADFAPVTLPEEPDGVCAHGFKGPGTQKSPGSDAIKLVGRCWMAKRLGPDLSACRELLG